MEKICLTASQGTILAHDQVDAVMDRYVDGLPGGLKKILLLPPDATRKHSGLGGLTRDLYHKLSRRAAVTIMPATGTHHPMTDAELAAMFGDVPLSKFAAHRWREDPGLLGIVPAAFVKEISSGCLEDPLRVTVNRRLMSGEFDLIISLGQVLPHEVVGMANYSKNILVGTGGAEIIHKSHFIGAVHGLERLIGRDHSPVRRLYDLAEEKFLKKFPVHYILTVNGTDIDLATGCTDLLGLFIGRDRSIFDKAVAMSQRHNIIRLPRPVKRFVVYLEQGEFRSTWICCKAIYRTRLAVADGGEIVIIAPGLDRLGEDIRFDRLIKRYGYVGTDRILAKVSADNDLGANLAVAAHLIHGSTEGRFNVIFASDAIAAKDIEAVNFDHMSLAKAQSRYDYERLAKAPQAAEVAEDIYYIRNPAAGLWVAEANFEV
jgi:nickel-dependent lactate racemase